MASPCELLMAIDEPSVAQKMLQIAYDEATRIEQKYSRFITHNDLWNINNSKGKSVVIDAETYALLEFAKQCYELSDGGFDVTAEPLMRLWKFDGTNKIPPLSEINKVKTSVDFSKIHFDKQSIRMPSGMSLDFGGIAKEYAVDKVANQLASLWPNISALVNFGGDIACPIAKLKEGTAWKIGIENPQSLDKATAILSLKQGALATSGDTRRFIEKNGKRYGHIINPKTGYPVERAPRSVTVLGPNCVTSGMLATMAMLKGKNAESFLKDQNLQFKILRD